MNQALSTKATLFGNNSAEYAMLQLLCHRNADVRITQSINNWSNLESFIYNISQPCGAMIVGCRFGAEHHHCADMFYPIVTDEGLCCVFNMLHPRFMYKRNIPITLRNVRSFVGYRSVDWFAEQGYPPHSHGERFSPLTAEGTGESLGLTLTLDVQADDYYCSSSNSIGFKMSLHSPNEAPNVRETGVLLAPGLESKLRIEPAKTVTEQHLRSVDRKYRRCLFHSEGRLRYFTHYTQRNCEMECLSRMLLKYCGCISFFMPRINMNDPVCSIRKSPCVESVRLNAVEAVESCLDDCLPSCFDLSYNSVSFSAKISHNGFEIVNPTVQNFSHEYVERSVAVVNIYYKDHTFRASKQTEFIGVSDFLSSVGGLMGLFLGFSFLSIIECIYFALIRPCRALAEWHQRNVSVTNNQLEKATTLNMPSNALFSAAEVMLHQHQQLENLHLARVLPVKWYELEFGHKQLQRA